MGSLPIVLCASGYLDDGLPKRALSDDFCGLGLASVVNHQTRLPKLEVLEWKNPKRFRLRTKPWMLNNSILEK